jgi:hypothetical protein
LSGVGTLWLMHRRMIVLDRTPLIGYLHFSRIMTTLSHQEAQNKFGYSYNSEDVVVPGFPTKSQFIVADLREESYDSALDIYWVEDGQLYEWTGGHCSCNGYEDYVDSFQNWDRLKVTVEAVLMRPYLDEDIRDALTILIPPQAKA